MTIPIDNQAVRRALASSADRAAAMLASIADVGVRMPNSEWTIREAAAHVISSLQVYGDAIAGTSELPVLDTSKPLISEQVAARNEAAIATVQETDPRALGDLIRQRVQHFLDATANLSGERTFEWHGRQDSTTAGMTGVMLGEIVVHGWDIAKAAGKPWEIIPADANMIMLGGLTLLPTYVNPETARGVKASYQINVRGFQRVGVRVENGVATIDSPPRGRADCYISADPEAMLLVSFGRIGQWGPIARGKMIAYGRKPWLGLKFTSLFLQP